MSKWVLPEELAMMPKRDSDGTGAPRAKVPLVTGVVGERVNDLVGESCRALRAGMVSR